jgi:PAS domain S-box-containing protein
MAGEYEVGFSFLAENSSDIICRAGLDLALHYASPSTLPLLGWQAKEVIGKSLNAFVPPP